LGRGLCNRGEIARFAPACGKIPVIPRNQAKVCLARGYRAFRLLLFYWIVAMYQSDITQFLEQLKTRKPSLEAEQRAGRSLLWDKQPVDLDESAEQKASRVPQTPYVYYQKF
jgi:hypothetical protein